MLFKHSNWLHCYFFENIYAIFTEEPRPSTVNVQSFPNVNVFTHHCGLTETNSDKYQYTLTVFCFKQAQNCVTWASLPALPTKPSRASRDHCSASSAWSSTTPLKFLHKSNYRFSKTFENTNETRRNNQ